MEFLPTTRTKLDQIVQEFINKCSLGRYYTQHCSKILEHTGDRITFYPPLMGLISISINNNFNHEILKNNSIDATNYLLKCLK